MGQQVTIAVSWYARVNRPGELDWCSSASDE